MVEDGRSSVRAIRILLAELTGLVAAFVKMAVARQPDMVIVDEIRSADDLDAAVSNGRVDVVMTLLSGAQVPAAYHGLLFRVPAVAVVAITADRRHIEAYDRRVVREVAPEQMLNAIRDLARRAASGDAPNDQSTAGGGES